MKYRCSIFCLHTVLFLVKYTWVCLFGWIEEYSLILNEKEFHRIYYTMMVLVLIGKKEKRNMEWKREKKLMRLPSPLCNNLVRNLNEKENCTKDQHTANTDQLQIVFIYFLIF